MVELRVQDPCDPMVVVRLKLSQGALGICDIYSDGQWWFRCHWRPFSGFDYEEVPGPLAEELAIQFHKLASRRARHATAETSPAHRD